jgi:hypothetical protein
VAATLVGVENGAPSSPSLGQTSVYGVHEELLGR